MPPIRRPEGAAETLLRGIIALYRLGRHSEAISQTQALLASYPAAGEALLARLWLGKSQIAAGEVVSGQATLAELAQSRPEDYEGTRAAELASDISRVPLSQDVWTRARATRNDIGVRTVRSGIMAARQAGHQRQCGHTLLQPDLAADPRLGRGSELWRMGLEDRGT